jgi:hypothetical protein
MQYILAFAITAITNEILLMPDMGISYDKHARKFSMWRNIHTRADQKYAGQNLLQENESIYKLLKVISFEVRHSIYMQRSFHFSMHVW